jgi:hypothetical protein
MQFRQTVLSTMMLTLSSSLFATLATAQDRHRSDAFNPDPQTVEFFQAMKEGKLNVKFIPLSDKAANVLIQNKTDKPLNVKLPEAFAGVPVLAQMGGMGGGGMGGMGVGGMGQGMGGGMGGRGGGMGGGGMGGGGGIFNVAPEKAGKLTVSCLCLDHGKPNPTPRMAYKIVPATEYVKNSAVIELLKLFGRGKIDHAAAQAATWNMNNHLSWQTLANKKIFSRRYVGGSIPYFRQSELRLAYRLSLYSQEQAQKSPPESPGSKSSSMGTSVAGLQPIAAP